MLLRTIGISLLAFALSACNLTGNGTKGPFTAGSSVSFAPLDSQANPISNQTIQTQVLSNQGDYSVDNIDWDGWSELQVSGQYFNEFDSSISSDVITLDAITRKDRRYDTANVHLFSHLAAARFRQRVENGQSQNNAWRDTQSDMKRIFGLSRVTRNYNRGVEQLSLLNGRGRYRLENANLLLFTGSFLATGGDQTSLALLTEDFADDAEFNGAGISVFNSIANAGATPDLITTLSNNLINYGIGNPPNQGDLPELPIWVNQTVGDLVPPVITIDHDNPLLIEVFSEELALGATAIDAVDGPVEVTISHNIDTSLVGDYEVVYTATDLSSNTESITVPVSVVDTEVPVISLIGNNPDILVVDLDEVPQPYQDSGTTVSDNYDNNLVATVSGQVNTGTVGEYILKYNVMDSSQNPAVEVERIVQIIPAPNQAPIASNQTVSVNEDVSIPITLQATDENNDVLNYSIVDQPSNGSITTAGQIITYTPTANYNGTDSFTFKANDGTVDSNVATVLININPVNDLPVANAGADTSVQINTPATLTGTGTDIEDDISGTPLSYRWSQFGGELVLAETATFAYTPTSNGAHTVTLTVTDSAGASSSDDVIVNTILPDPYEIRFSLPTNTTVVPRNITVAQLNQVLGFLGLVYDGEGNPVNGLPTFDASGVDLNQPDSYSVVYSYVDPFERTVTNTLTVIVENNAPIAIGQNITVIEDSSNNPITLSANDSNLGDTLTYSITTQPSNGTLSGDVPNISYTPSPNFDQTDSFSFTVSDGIESSTANINILVTAVNDLPSVDAGPDTATEVGSPVSLTGSGSDVEDGSNVSFTWTLQGSETVLSDTAQLSYTPTEEGVHTLILTVTDSENASVSDSVVVTASLVPNVAPTADAGNDATILLGDSTTLDGSASADSDGSIVSYDWSEGGSSIGSGATFVYTPTTAGTHTITLTVTDDRDAVSTDTVTVNVNTPPTVNAGRDSSLHINTPITLSAIATDDGGSIQSYLWEDDGVQVATSASFIYTPSIVGIHNLTVTVTDNDGATASDTVVITVEPPNEAPTVNAGNDVSVEQGSSVLLSGTGSDSDGSIVEYLWTETINGVITELAASADLNYSSSVLGDRILTLFVIDDDNAISTDTVIVTVTEPVVAEGYACHSTVQTESQFIDSFVANQQDDFDWPQNLSFMNLTVNDIEAAFNAARATDFSINTSFALKMPSQFVWNGYSDAEKVLFLINSERCARGIRPYEGVDTNMVQAMSQAYANLLAAQDLPANLSHTLDGRTPFERLTQDANVIVETNADFFSRGENLAFTSVGSFGGLVGEPVFPTVHEAAVKAVYGWIYDDKQSTASTTNGVTTYSYGHRKFVLATGLVENSGLPNQEGILTAATATKNYQTFNEELEETLNWTRVYTVNNGFDPNLNWDMSNVQSVDLVEPVSCLFGATPVVGDGGEFECQFIVE